MQLQIGNRLTNQAARFAVDFRRSDSPIGDMNRRFGDAIHVDQSRRVIAILCHPRFEAMELQRFAAEYDFSQTVRLRIAKLFIRTNQLPKRRWRLIENRYFLVAKQPEECLRRATDFVRHDDQFSTVQQSAPDFPN